MLVFTHICMRNISSNITCNILPWQALLLQLLVSTLAPGHIDDVVDEDDLDEDAAAKHVLRRALNS